MVAPLVAGIAIIVGGAALGVVTGVAIDKTLGDGKYTRREMATDATLGAIPGLGLIRPAGKIAMSLRHIRHYDKAKGDRLLDIPVALAFYNRREINTIAKTIATEKVVSHIAGQLIAESGRPSSMSFQQNGGRPGKRPSRVSGTRKVSWSKKGGKWSPSCPTGYKLQRVGKSLMCVKS